MQLQTEVMKMDRHNLNRGFDLGPMDDRDEDNPDFEVDPEFSCTNTDFGGVDPAEEGPGPIQEIAPAWNTADPEEDDQKA